MHKILKTLLKLGKRMSTIYTLLESNMTRN